MEILHAFSDERLPRSICIAGAPFLDLWNLVQKRSFPVEFVENAYELAKNYLIDLKTKVSHLFLAIVDRSEPCYKFQNELLRDLSAELDIPLVPILEQYYSRPEDAEDHKIYIASKTKVKPREYSTLEDRYKRFYMGDYS